MAKLLYKRCEKKNSKINLWFAYPAIESFAMASLGYLTIFQMLDCDCEIFTERIYFDSKTTFLTKNQVDFMGFSVSFEIDILTIIKMLKKYDIPLKANERNENNPIIFAGGPVLMSNPLPFEEFFDFIIIGEKTALKTACAILKKRKEFSKDKILKELSEIKGIYVPKYKKQKIETIRDEITNEPVYTPILSDKSFFKDTFIIELERGCPKMCNFCLASWLNIPTRFVNYEKIIETIDFGLTHTNKIALLGAYVAGHPEFDKIIKYIAKKCEKNPIELSISSLRADLTDINLVKTLVKCGQKTATIAIEAASQRLRDFIGKDLNEQQILNTIKICQQGGLKGIKIYAMIGLPTENDKDIEEFIELAKKMKNELKKSKESFEITFSTSSFIPKPHTPFENAVREDKKILENKVNYLKKNFHRLGINFRAPSIEWDNIQSILSVYDKSLADFLIEVADEGANLGAFKKTWRKYNKNGVLPPLNSTAKTLFHNTKAISWDFIYNGSKELKLQRQKRLKQICSVQQG